MKGIEHVLVAHVLIATDFGPASERAHTRLDIANRLDAKLTVVHALEAAAYAYPLPIPEDARQVARASLDAAAATARTRVPGGNGVVREGVGWEEIVSAAKDLGTDLVIIGSHGRHGLPRWLLGSVAERGRTAVACSGPYGTSLRLTHRGSDSS
jgi:nucleotide-binding universal stress UspA family protein